MAARYIATTEMRAFLPGVYHGVVYDTVAQRAISKCSHMHGQRHRDRRRGQELAQQCAELMLRRAFDHQEDK